MSRGKLAVRSESSCLHIVLFLVVTITYCTYDVTAEAAMLAWDRPTKNVDSTDLEDLSGYIIYYGTISGSFSGFKKISDADVTSYSFEDLTSNETYYFYVVAYNSNGHESDPSNWVVQSIAPPPPPDDMDGDGILASDDCDDNDPDRFPGNKETCDGKDNDCDDLVDNELSAPLNTKQDGVCKGSTQICGGPEGWIDNYSVVDGYEGVESACDNRDNDCDGLTDENLTRETTCGTGSCAGNTGAMICSEGLWADDSCDPFEGASDELCDGIDNDCDSLVDDADPDLIGLNSWYMDSDRDLFGDPLQSVELCDKPEGYVQEQGDCNDLDRSINPGMPELPYNGKDDDCNAATYDDDLDGDGYPSHTDCDDNNYSVNPGALEIPLNGRDDDCNLLTDDGIPDDGDGDGYTEGQDCNDNDEYIHPGSVDIAFNGVDEDCDGIDRAYHLQCSDGGQRFCLERVDGGSDNDNLIDNMPKNGLDFRFMASVSDNSGNLPQSVTVYMSQRDRPAADDFFPYSMDCHLTDVNVTECAFISKLGPAANHKYFFEALLHDHVLIRYPETGYLDGPDIQLLNGYNLIGIPRDLEDVQLDGIDAFRSLATYRWDNDDNYYFIVTSSEPVIAGEGYFSYRQTANIPGFDEYDDIKGSEYPLILQGGWNIISNPYSANVLLSDLKIRKGSAVPVSWDVAVDNGWVINAVYYNNGADWGGTYGFATGDDAWLIPWQAYWISLEVSDDTYSLVFSAPRK